MSDNSIPWLRDNTILLVMAGSRAYGTNTPTSDVDIKGVAIPPVQYFLGFANHFEQADKPMHAATFLDDMSPEIRDIAKETKLEGSVYEIRKFFSLAADCNPNILDVLYSADDDVIRITEAGEQLRKNRDMFLSRVAKHRFSGYALSQLSRIKTHRKWLIDPPTAAPQREDFGLRPQVSIPMAQLQAVQAEVQKQLDRWNEGYMDDLSESSKVRVREGIAQLLAELKISSDIRYAAAARSMGFEENFIVYLQMEREYGNALRHWRLYLEWKDKRNEDRAILERKFGYDCYLDDTEFLTSRGWLRYDEVRDTDTLATLNQGTGRIEYQGFTDRVVKPYTGRIAFLHPQHSNCAVTMNHRMWVSRVHRSPTNGFSTTYVPEGADWGIRTMDDLLAGKASYYHIRIAGTPTTKIYPVSDDTLILMGCYVSEGCVGKRLTDGTASVLRISQKAGGRQGKFMDLLKVRHPEKVRKFTYLRDEEFRATPCEEQIWTVSAWASDMEEWCGSGSGSKHLPAWVNSLTADQVDLLLDVMVAGDGSNRPHSRIYHTSSKRLADDIQAMCVSAGIISQVWGPYGGEDSCPMYQVYLGERQETLTVCLREEGSNHVTVEEVKDARIVCFTVPNEILVTRRGGKVAIQGNTKHAMHLVRLLRMCREILMTGRVNVKRPDSVDLLGIRNGDWTFDALIEWADKEDKELTALIDSSPLPRSSNKKLLDELCLGMVRAHLKL